MLNDIDKILFTEEEIQAQVKHLGEIISREYEGRDLLMICILKGAVVFMTDLMRAVSIPCAIDFMSVSSYGKGVKTSGMVKILKDVDVSLEGRSILIVEDILDSGITLKRVIEILKVRGPESVKICTLFDKPSRRQADISADYGGLLVPDAFIVGYGLDYDEKYRNLPFVGELKRSVYEK